MINNPTLEQKRKGKKKLTLPIYLSLAYLNKKNEHNREKKSQKRYRKLLSHSIFLFSLLKL